jgi:hypothetical protein
MVPRVEPAGTLYPAEVQALFDKILPPGAPPLRLFTTLARDARLFERFFNGGRSRR